MASSGLCKAFALVGITIALAVSGADAGGIRINPISVEINGGQSRPARPGDSVDFSFTADMFAFGSDQFEYVLFSVVPEKNSLKNLDFVNEDPGKLYAYVMGTVSEQPSYSRYPRLTVQLAAPYPPGTYKIIYYGFPFFSKRPLDALGLTNSTYVPVGAARRELALYISKFGDQWAQVGTFSVATGQDALSPPKLYLTANGEIPGTKPIKTGTVERPLTFEWRINPDFRLPRTNVSYRYQMLLDGDEWSDWSRATETAIFFYQGALTSFACRPDISDQRAPSPRRSRDIVSS